MEYTITSHDDTLRIIFVLCKGYAIQVKYPEDVDVYTDMSEETLALLITGIVAPYADMPVYQEPSNTTPSTEWF